MPKGKRRKAKSSKARRGRSPAATAVYRHRPKGLAKWVFGGGAAVIGILTILSMLLPRLPGGQQPAWPGQRVPIMESPHIAEGTTFNEYNTIPPTSGPHYDKEAPWGIHDQEVPDELAVHNLEHSGVVISYNLDDPQAIERLKELVRGLPDYPCYILLRPYPKIPKGLIALTAWGVIEALQEVDEDRILEFIRAYRGNELNAPEKPPCTPQAGG